MRAIILAAGLGTRLRPLTNDKPKSLVEVCGEPMTERQIRFLKEKNIDDITVVAGYKFEMFDYLIDKYGVKLVYNDKFDKYNNIYSLYLVRDKLDCTYIFEGDIYMHRNIIDENISTSTYFSCKKEDFKNEWKIINDGDKVKDIVITDGDGYILNGVSYWSGKESETIKKLLDNMYEIDGFENLYWDNLIKDNIELFNNIEIKRLKSDDLYEVDSENDLKRVEEELGYKSDKN